MAAEIEKRIGKNGKVSWVTVLSLPRNKDDGTRKQIHITRPTKREVETERARASSLPMRRVLTPERRARSKRSQSTWATGYSRQVQI